jgi:hypothetical protein
MTIHHESHRERIAAGVGFEWDRLPPVLVDVAQVPEGTSELRLRRDRRSHHGLRKHGQLRKLWAYGVDQAFLAEIAALPRLELLHLDQVAAADLTPLSAMGSLSRLTLVGATKVRDLEWLAGLGGLRTLGLEHLPSVHDLAPLAALPMLTALAVEGSLWKAMRVDSLQPMAGLRDLEALFLTNLRVSDRSLRPLHGLAHLQTLQCARHFPAAEFAALAAARPGLDCGWLAGN